jgi:hypothetical protein
MFDDHSIMLIGESLWPACMLLGNGSCYNEASLFYLETRASTPREQISAPASSLIERRVSAALQSRNMIEHRVR